MRRNDRLFGFVLAAGLCLFLYWPGLRAWFQQDDFSWLALSQSVHSPRDLPRALFAPMAQGTIRPLSERAFFMVFETLFGPDPRPFRLWVFFTQFGSILLAGEVAWRITRSRLAAVLAPLFWVANGALATAMSWTSAYNQVLAGFFLLAAFYSLLRYVESGDRRWMLAQWAAFAGGIGSLETAVVYPAIAAAYTLACARKYFRGTLPLVVVSAVYAALRLASARPVADPLYALHLDRSLFPTLWTYWTMALGTARLHEVAGWLPVWVERTGVAALTAGLLLFALDAARRRRWVRLVPFVWFFAALAPVLPLRDHVYEYYLTAAVFGLALAGAWAVAEAGRPPARAVAVTLACVYLLAGATEARTASRILARRSLAVRTMVLGALRARQVNPGKSIILDGVSEELFWAGIFDLPFPVWGLDEVYLAPGSEDRIPARPGRRAPASYAIPPEILLRLFDEQKAVVYQVEPDRLRGQTLPYEMAARERWQPALARRIDVGRPAFAAQLGPEWYGIEDGRRWMPQRATLWLGGPQHAGATLHVEGFCQREQSQIGPVRIAVTTDSTRLPDIVIAHCGEQFQADLPLSPEVAGRPRIKVSIEVDKVYYAPGDGRPLGAVFGRFEVR
jgi:hypothetical protein